MACTPPARFCAGLDGVSTLHPATQVADQQAGVRTIRFAKFLIYSLFLNNGVHIKCVSEISEDFFCCAVRA